MIVLLLLILGLFTLIVGLFTTTGLLLVLVRTLFDMLDVKLPLLLAL